MIAFTDGSTTSYQYDALGRKLRVEHKTMTTGTLMLSRIGCGSEKFKQVWLPTRLALSFHPDTGTEDPGDVGSAPDPEVGEEAGEEGGEWQWPVEGEEWPELAGLEEMEGEEGEPAPEEGGEYIGEEPTLPPTPPTCLPYEITVTVYIFKDKSGWNGMTSTISNVQSLLGIHEYLCHYLLDLNHNPNGVDPVHEYQKQHPSWKKTSNDFKKVFE